MGVKKNVSISSWLPHEEVKRYRSGKVKIHAVWEIGLKEFYENGQMMLFSRVFEVTSRGRRKRYVPVGSSVVEWHENGAVKAQYSVSDTCEPQLCGEYKEFYENGQLKRHCFYDDGDSGYPILDGEFVEFDKDGTLLDHCFYEEYSRTPISAEERTLRNLENDGVKLLPKSSLEGAEWMVANNPN